MSSLSGLNFLTALEKQRAVATDEFDTSELIGVIVLMLLFAFLCWRLDRPTRLALKRQKSSEKEWSQKGFDAASVSSQIRELRRNFVPAVRAHNSFGYGRRERIAKARCAVSRFCFFQRFRSQASLSASQQSGEIASVEHNAS